MSILDMQLFIGMPDGSIWSVPVRIIAEHRAQHYAEEFGDDAERSLAEDTGPLFEEHPAAIAEWAGANMDWGDVEHVAQDEVTPEPCDMQDGWVNGPKDIDINDVKRELRRRHR